MMEMRRVRGLCAPALVGMLLAACGGGGGEEAASEEGGAPEAGAVTEHPVPAETAGNIGGTVRFTGTPPAPEPLDMSDEPTCQEAHQGQPVKRVAVVGPDGGLANVFVYVKEGLDASLQFPAGEAVVLDQVNCEYTPHVVGLTAGQQLTVRNSDSFLHNINATPSENRGFNRSQPNQGMEFQTAFAEPEVMIPVRCDVHGWMESFIGVTAHPYHAVTAENGTFTLDRLPPGNYVVEAWHERFGTQTQNVTVATGQTAEVTFTFDAANAARVVPMGPALVVDHATGTLKRVSQ
jgi:plastocyanin